MAIDASPPMTRHKNALDGPKRLPPSKLYKYRDLPATNTEMAKWRRTEIVDTSVHFSKPSILNDPFESLHEIQLDATEQELREYACCLADKGSAQLDSQWIDEQVVRMRSREYWIRTWSNVADHAGHYCLSSESNSRLMWSFYADNCMGYCLEFTIDDADWNERTLPQAVVYRKSRPPISTGALIRNQLEPSFANTREPEWLEQRIRSLFLTKHKDWSFESEWRLMLSSIEGGPGIHELPPRLLTGIILGARMDCERRNRLRHWVEERLLPPRLFQAVPESQQLAYRVEECSWD